MGPRHVRSSHHDNVKEEDRAMMRFLGVRFPIYSDFYRQRYGTLDVTHQTPTRKSAAQPPQARSAREGGATVVDMVPEHRPAKATLPLKRAG
jgi:hypothetical protein